MQRDRFLFAIIIGIGVLVLVALVLFFIRQGNTSYQDETTPTGVISNYVLALQARDYQRAHDYLADLPKMPSLTSFQEPFLQYQASELANTPVEIGEVITNEALQTAVVQITLVRGGRGFLDEVYREAQTAHLVKQDGMWKIIDFPYPYWSYEWTINQTPEILPPQPQPAP